MMLGSVGVGSVIGVADGCGGSDAIGSTCMVCSVSTIVVGASSSWDVGLGLGSSCTSSVVLCIGEASGSSGRGVSSCGTSTVVGGCSKIGASAGVVNYSSSWAVGIAAFWLELLSGSSTVSTSPSAATFRSTSYSWRWRAISTFAALKSSRSCTISSE